MLPPGQRSLRRFVIYSALGQPTIDIERYALRVRGNVAEELSIPYRQLLEMKDTSYEAGFHCVTGWSVEGIRWSGISLRALLARARPLDGSSWVVFRGLDGYTAPVPLEDSMDERAIVALEMDGGHLSLEHGFPARPFIPHLYGWKSVKWLGEIEIDTRYEDGYWEAYGYHERGNVHLEERFKRAGL